MWEQKKSGSFAAQSRARLRAARVFSFFFFFLHDIQTCISSSLPVETSHVGREGLVSPGAILKFGSLARRRRGKRRESNR